MDEATEKLRELEQNLNETAALIRDQTPATTAYDQLRSIRKIAQSMPEPVNTNEAPEQYIHRLNSTLNVIVEIVNNYERKIGKGAL